MELVLVWTSINGGGGGGAGGAGDEMVIPHKKEAGDGGIGFNPSTFRKVLDHQDQQ